MRLLSTLIFLLVCGIAMAQQNVADSLEHQNYQRQYIVHLPPTYTGTVDVPVVIVLHGGSGTSLNAQGFTEMNFVSNQNNFLAVYPEGIGDAPPGYSWADGRNTTADQAGIDDVGFITKLIGQLSQDYSVDTTKVYVCGFSNGGFMTQRLACEIPEKFAAIAGLGCSIDTSLIRTCKPQRPVPMAYFFGTTDPEVPYGGGNMKNPSVTAVVAVDTAVEFWVKNNNCQKAEDKFDVPNSVQSDNSTVEFYKYTDCDCDADFYFYKILGGGHTWPGVPIAQFPQLGNTNEDIHASYLLWDFFKQFSICDEPIGKAETPIAQDILVYPNPVQDVLHLQSSKEIERLEIITSLGTSSSHNLIDGNTLDFSNYKAGVYFLRIFRQDESSLTVRIVKG